MAIGAALCVVIPLSRKKGEVIDQVEHDKALYHARLKEIDHDKELGRISSQEAQSAITEEGRKLIAVAGLADGRPNPAPSVHPSSSHNVFRILSLILVPTLALIIYLQLGSPQMRDNSLASRLSAAPNGQSLSQLLARAEAHLAKTPNDAKGWAIVAPVYSRLGRAQDSVSAWSNVYRLNPDYPEIRALLGESILSTSEGVITDRARKLFEAELAVNPASARSRFYLATALAQQGDNAAAAQAWQDLIDGANPQAPWLKAAQEYRDNARKLAGLPQIIAVPDAPGPTGEQVRQAGDMSAEDRAAMIENMIAGLAEKLDKDPSDKGGWQRLVRAYMVQGKRDAAMAAIETALIYHKSDAEFSATMNAARTSLNSENQGGEK